MEAAIGDESLFTDPDIAKSHHYFITIPKMHSTSLQTLSMLVEKYPLTYALVNERIG
jgi:hypothetical protein